jgi:hypothetical protein
MERPSGANPLPTSVKLAAALFLLYGAVVLFNATVMQSEAGWTMSPGLPRVVIRLVGVVLIAWGLFHQARWAWWLGVVLALFWLGTGVLATAVLERGDVYWLPPSGFQIPLAVSLLCLGLALALLLSPAARRVFQRPPAP